jgi:phosphoribosyl-ATP pyrophosphohydrolase/phosphoribosyl-AMP cyclohydrolase
MMLTLDKTTLNFDKLNGLIPVCIQDNESLQVLMIGFMNEQALQQTIETKRITFFSRTKNRLWTKGETSGHFLTVHAVSVDCDSDSLLFLVSPRGPTCHTGSVSCFDIQPSPPSLWQSLAQLNQTIHARQSAGEESYTRRLLNEGVSRMAQKVGEEGVEVALAAVSGTVAQCVNEVVDLWYHVLVLLMAKDISLSAVAELIQQRSRG